VIIYTGSCQSYSSSLAKPAQAAPPATMESASLPIHARAFDKPAPSEMVTGLNGAKAYRWVLTESERAHIAEMLNIDGK